MPTGAVRQQSGRCDDECGEKSGEHNSNTSHLGGRVPGERDAEGMSSIVALCDPCISGRAKVQADDGARGRRRVGRRRHSLALHIREVTKDSAGRSVWAALMS
jgi:hypothetical protein